MHDDLPPEIAHGVVAIEDALGPPASPGMRALLTALLLEQHRGSTRLDLSPSVGRALVGASWPEEDALLASAARLEAARLVVRGDGWIAPAGAHALEVEVASALERRQGACSVVDSRAWDAAIADLERDQRDAVSRAAASKTACITGGPGSGKTTVLGALMRGLLAGGVLADRVALAAPTGKAASRMTSAVPEARPARTLHRLLGWNPRRGAFSEDMLDVDAVLVDEASMLSVDLMAALLRALPEDARLTLIGDPDQLPSVAAGAPFRDLVEARPEIVSRLTGQRRQSMELQRVAAATHAGTLRWAGGTRDEDAVRFIEIEGAPPAELLLDWLTQHPSQPILTVTKEGPCGARGINARFEALRRRRIIDGPLEGRPMMVVKNDPARGLFNGDMGVVARDGALEVNGARWPMGSVAGIIDPADAMTVHKSQGSEFEAVMLLLPPRPHPLITRSLLYTAITRARRRLWIVGQPQTLHTAVERRRVRSTMGTKL